jgi:hypothetical protein
MEKVKKYWVESEKFEDAYFKKLDAIIRPFFIKKSDSVRLTRVTYFSLNSTLLKNIFKYGFKKATQIEPEEQLKVFKDRFGKDILEIISNNKRFDDVPQFRKLWEHYFLRLTPRVRKALAEDTIYFESYVSSINFLGFEDPVFYKNKKMIGGSISHENMVFLYLTQKEKKELESKGVKLC